MCILRKKFDNEESVCKKTNNTRKERGGEVLWVHEWVICASVRYLPGSRRDDLKCEGSDNIKIKYACKILFLSWQEMSLAENRVWRRRKILCV